MIINTILSIGIAISSLGLTMGAGYAQERRRGQGALGSVVMVLTFTLPLTVAVSIIGSWTAFFSGNDVAVYGFMAAPWVDLLFVTVAMKFLYSH